MAKARKLVLASFLQTTFKRFSTTNNSELGVIIPKRIERGSTDILKALSEIVGRDPTACHYKFPDDPYFNVDSLFLKRTAALSLESGRKAARWIVNNNSQFFNEKTSEPFIEKFTPKHVYNENSDVVEETLIDVIERKHVSNAIIVYNLLSNKGIELSADTKQMLLELVCFYNGEDKENKDELESKWYHEERKLVAKTWKDNGFAEKLFESLKPNCPLAYSAIIQGMLKYGQIDKAMELYDVACEENLLLSVDVYNAILMNVKNIKESNRWDFIMNLLEEMDRKKITPNLSTMNSVLYSLSYIKKLRGKKMFGMKSFGEFISLGIKPSLGTYFHLFNILFRDQGKPEIHEKDVVFLKEVLQELSEEKLEIQHPSDVLFFTSTMELLATILHDPTLAHFLHKILLKNDNVKFLSTDLDEAIYFNNYLLVSFTMEPIECAMELYKNFVPTIFNPDSMLIQVIISKIMENEMYEYLSTIWHDTKYLSRLEHSHCALVLLESWSSSLEIEGDALDVFLHAADFILERLSLEDAKYKVDLSEVVVSNMMILFLKFEAFDKAVELFDKSDIFTNDFIFNAEALAAFFDFCLSRQMQPQILSCLKLGEKTLHPNLREMAKNALPCLSSSSKADLKWVGNLAENSTTNLENNKVQNDY